MISSHARQQRHNHGSRAIVRNEDAEAGSSSRSAANSPSIQLSSPAESQKAFSGRSTMYNAAATASTALGTASNRNMYRQGARPIGLPTPSSQPHKGPPRTIDSGTATSAPASARPRIEGGAQREISQVMPGAKPASATPSRKRAA